MLVALFAANCLIVCVCGEVTATRGDARGCPLRETWTRLPIAQQPTLPSRVAWRQLGGQSARHAAQGNAARRGAREASRGLPVASPPTLYSVGEPAVARALSRVPATILLRARRRFTASAGPRSPGRFRAPWQPNEAAVHSWPNEKLGQRTQSTECLVARLGHEPGRNQASAPLRCPNPAAIPRHAPTDAGTRLVDSREGTHN